MTYVVNDKCIKCKLTDCVDVCPVDCFYEGKNMLVIKPDECIDCGVCEPECPVDAIKADTEPGSEQWLELNKQYSEIWPNISEKKDTPSDHEKFKNEENKIILQEIYDFIFRQLELSIREIGYGDQSINKKMKDYINLFHSMVSEIHFWGKLSRKEKYEKFAIFLTDFNEIDHLIDYFELFNEKLSKKTLNSYLKSVSNP